MRDSITMLCYDLKLRIEDMNNIWTWVKIESLVVSFSAGGSRQLPRLPSDTELQCGSQHQLRPPQCHGQLLSPSLKGRQQLADSC